MGGVCVYSVRKIIIIIKKNLAVIEANIRDGLTVFFYVAQ